MRRRLRTSKGFSIVEVSLATVIVGVAVVSLMELFFACTTQNGAASRLSTAMFLASNVREAMANVSFDDPYYGRVTPGPDVGETLATYDDLDDFSNASFNPPIDARRQTVAGMDGYTQTVTVQDVDPNRPTVASPGNAARQVTVRVTYQRDASQPSGEVFRLSWLEVE